MCEKLDWLVQVPIDDMEAWTTHRAAHVAHLQPYISNGTIVFAGPTLAAHPQTPTDPFVITSSVMLFRAESAEEVRDIVRQNPFVEVGVWDLERVVVSPFRCGVRTALA